MRSHPNPTSIPEDVIKRISSKARDVYSDQYAQLERLVEKTLAAYQSAGWRG